MVSPLLREDPLISEFCALEENASHHVGRRVEASWIIGDDIWNHETSLGGLILRMRGGAKHSPHLRTQKSAQKSSKPMLTKIK